MPEIRPLSPLPATRNFFSVNYSTNICSPFKSRLRAYFDFCTEHTAPFPDAAPGSLTKTAAKRPSRRLVFRPKIRSFLCPENVPQKCKWQQCVRLVINKRRPSPDVAAAPQRHPLAALAGADQAHTLSQTNRPLNYSIFYRTNAPKARNTFTR